MFMPTPPLARSSWYRMSFSVASPLTAAWKEAIAGLTMRFFSVILLIRTGVKRTELVILLYSP